MRTLKTLYLSSIFGTLCSAASCGGGPGLACTDLYAYGLTVNVVDAMTGQAICDATVTATEGAYSEQLQKFELSATSCAYNGAGERAGTYSLTAVKSGYMNATQSNVIVTADACHVKGVSVTLRMSR